MLKDHGDFNTLNVNGEEPTEPERKTGYYWWTMMNPDKARWGIIERTEIEMKPQGRVVGR